MRTVYLVQRILKLGTGSQMILPVALFDTLKAARDASSQLQAGMAPMLECKIARPAGKGEFQDTGIFVGQFLVDLGVVAFRHDVLELEMGEAGLIADPRSAILAS